MEERKIRRLTAKRDQVIECFLEKTSFEVKQQILKSILKLPARVSEFLNRLKPLREVMAAVDFPGVARKNVPEYKGESIYTLKNFKRFMKNSSECKDSLMKAAKK